MKIPDEMTGPSGILFFNVYLKRFSINQHGIMFTQSTFYFFRDNIYIKAVDSGQLKSLDWVVDLIRTKGRDCPKIVIFASSVGKVAKVYRYVPFIIHFNVY